MLKTKLKSLQILQTALFGLLAVLGLSWRLYHIEFGLPHSFHADEPEIAELAIKYTFEIRTIVQETAIYKLIPINFVYGTVPVYLLTAFVMAFSKLSNLVGNTFDKTELYIYMRMVTALFSWVIPFATLKLYAVLFKKPLLSFGGLLTFALTTLNWKLIVHSHYVNVDTFFTLFLLLSFVSAALYFRKDSDTKYTVLMGIFYGLAVGTKVTALLTLPLYLLLFVSKKHIREMFAFGFVVFGTFVVTNPFSLIFAQDFVFRVYMLSVKENGLVFDSADFGYFKYLFALSDMVTLPVILLAMGVLLGSIFTLKKTILNRKWHFHLFLLANVLVFLLFYSLGNRRVDRWLLPVVPLFLMYGAFTLELLHLRLNKYVFVVLFLGFFGIYLQKPLLLLSQYNTNTPKSEAYLWMRDNVSEQANKLVITKEGLDPMNKLQGVRVYTFQAYESENAQYALPPSPNGYDYMIIASKPLDYYKNPIVRKKYAFYYEAWNKFEQTVLDETKFELVKSFVLPKPNLIEVSDVFVYRTKD